MKATALTRKEILVDRNLSSVIGAQEGTLVSYTEITKGVHHYIYKNNLRQKGGKAAIPPVRGSSGHCPSCGNQITPDLKYCDNCGGQL